MKSAFHFVLVAISLTTLAAAPHAQIAGSTTADVEVSVTQAVVLGLSAKRQVIGQRIYNEQGDTVGRIDDLIVAPDDAVSFAIVGAGGFVGLRRHLVAIPVSFLTLRDGGFTLAGATKAAIKSLPAFEYSAPLDRGITHNPIFRR